MEEALGEGEVGVEARLGEVEEVVEAGEEAEVAVGWVEVLQVRLLGGVRARAQSPSRRGGVRSGNYCLHRSVEPSYTSVVGSPCFNQWRS